MASRKIEHLHPLMIPLAREFDAACDVEFAGTPIDVILTSTYRSAAEQDALWEQGRSKPGPIVTKAKGGQSKHNFALPDGTPASLAFDVVPVRGGVAIWGSKGNGIDLDPTDDVTDDLEIWQRIGAIGVRLGLDWYGSPGAPFKEFPHFQHAKANELMKGFR
jgi:peptidoglycan L-alanyl-D-glutamate endopeptidase CwlK